MGKKKKICHTEKNVTYIGRFGLHGCISQLQAKQKHQPSDAGRDTEMILLNLPEEAPP